MSAHRRGGASRKSLGEISLSPLTTRGIPIAIDVPSRASRPPRVGHSKTAETIEPAAPEKFVHLAGIGPSDLLLVGEDVPGAASLIRHVETEDLPVGWNDHPAADAAQGFGTDRLERAVESMHLLPSALIRERRNAVINPLHPRHSDVAITRIRPFLFDENVSKSASRA